MSTPTLKSVSGSGKPVFVNPPGLYDPAPNGYSHLAIVETPARFVYAAGQGGETGTGYLSPSFEEQMKQALENVQTALSAANADMSDVVKLTLLVVDHTEERLGTFVSAIKTLMGDRPAPPCTLIPVPRLALDGMLVEIEVTAVLRF